MTKDKDRKIKTDDSEPIIDDQKPPAKDQAEIKELQDKCAEYLNGWKRAKADYENLKKDEDKRVKDLAEYAAANIILEVLTVYDHFKLALAYQPAGQLDQKWLEGINHIKTEFEQFLKKFGIEEIITVGAEFNPAYHEAVGQEESVQRENTIVKEIKSGYKMGEKVLQPARVIVSKNKSMNV